MPRGVRFRSVIALVAIVSAAVCIFAHEAEAAKSYRITDVAIEAQLRSDGAMDVTEVRTYQFQGAFRFVYRDLPAAGPVSFENLSVSEGGSPYRLADSEEPGTYKIGRAADQTRVTWYFKAVDGSRAFDFHYRARNAVVRHDDAAVLYFKFLSEDWDRPQESVAVRVKPPVALSRDKVNEWLHGPLWATSVIQDDGTTVATCQRLPAHTYLEVRALYPPEIFAAAPLSGGSVRQAIMAEEAGWATEANRKREAAVERQAAKAGRATLGKWLVVGLSLTGLAAWWWIFSNYGRRPQVPPAPEMSSDIPERLPPALVSYLLSSRTITGSAAVGTMLDLAKRGFVSLREEVEDTKGLFGGTKPKPQHYWDLNRSYLEQHAGQLAGFETSLLRFFFDELAGGQNSISMKAIGKARRKFTRFFGEWKKQVDGLGKQRGWFDPGGTRGMYYSFAIAAAMMVLAVAAALVFGIMAVILVMASAAVFVLGLFVPHRTAEGETVARRWGGLKKYLRRYQFREAGNEGLLSRISDYLVYGVVLGVGDKVYKELAVHIPATDHAIYVPWYVYHGGTAGGFSPASFGAAFSSMVATVTSTMSTATGTGGGASGGGGGGASSGGGGAG